jgi:hypothetical protein
MKIGGHRYTGRALGSIRNGIQKPHRSPRIAITWPHDLLVMVSDEAEALNLPFAEIVRRRIRASYEEQK